MTARPASSDTKLPPIVSRCYRALVQEHAALEKALEGYAKEPKAGCAYLSEKNDLWKLAPHHQRRHRQRLWTDATNQSILIVGNVLDHLWATSRLLNGESLPLYAHMTLSRVLAEAAARLCYLLDPAITYEGRIVRGAVLGLYSVNANLTAARSLPASAIASPNALIHTTKERDKLEDRIDRAGLTYKLNAKGNKTHLQHQPSGISEPLDVKLTQLVEKYFAHRPAWYRLSSGVIHSSRWMLIDLVTQSDQRGVTMTPDLLGIGITAMSAIDASQAVAKVYAQFYGHDPQPAARASALRTQAVDLFITELASAKGLT